MKGWLASLDRKFAEVPEAGRGPALLGLVLVSLVLLPPLTLALNLLVLRWWRQETKRRQAQTSAETVRLPRASGGMPPPLGR